MLSDARELPDGAELEGDVCIVGAGAAGLAVARALIRTPLRIILLEGGGLQFESDTQSLYEGPVAGVPYFPLDTARLRFFGGSTNHWGGICRRFDPSDFERRDWIPGSGWPIGLADVEPYYSAARELVQLPTDDWDVDQWEEEDELEAFPRSDRMATRVSQIVPKSKRSFGSAYSRELEAAETVRCYLHANVVEIDTNEAASAVTKLRVATLTGKRMSVAARYFVLATGGIENPRLLLASNRRRPNGLGNDHDLVGRYFIEHPRFEAGVLAPARRTLQAGFYEAHHVEGTEIQGYLALPFDVQRSEQLVDVQLLMDPVYDPRFERALESDDVDSLESLVQDRGGGSIGDFGSNLMKVVGDLTTGRRFTVPGAPLPVPHPDVVRKLVASPEVVRDSIPDLLGNIAGFSYKRAVGAAPLDAITIRSRIDQAPNRDSRVTLVRERDALGMPRARLDWRLSELDRHSAVRTMEIIGAAVARAGLGRLRVMVDADDRSWPTDLAGGYHHMGTTRMSDAPETGVVDGACRVHGIANLFVAGSSVFTTGGSSTPTLTIVALALRLADHLKRIAA